MKRFIFTILGILVLAGVVGGVLYFKKEPTSATEDPMAKGEKGAKTKEIKPIPVTVEKVVGRPIQRIVRVVGSLYGQEEITITPKVEGKITRIHADVGDLVKPGDPLLDIDETDYKLAVTEAKRSLELELSKLGLRELPKEKFDITQLPMVVKASTLEKNTQSRKERLNRLGGGLVSSPEDREQADTDNRVAKANYQQAMLEAMTTIAAAEHRQAVLETAIQRLKDTRVVVPFPEMGPKGPKTVEFAITQRMASQGELLKSGPSTSMSVFKMVIDNPLKLQATVPERHLSEIKVGQMVNVEVEAYRNEVFQGRVMRVNPMVERNNRTFQIEVEIPNDSRRLHAGSFAKASILTEVDLQAITVPEDAVINFAGVTKVFVVRDEKAWDIPVTTGVRTIIKSGGREIPWVEVRGNLKIGEQVVTSGQSRLSDGRLIKIRTVEDKIRTGEEKVPGSGEKGAEKDKVAK